MAPPTSAETFPPASTSELSVAEMPGLIWKILVALLPDTVSPDGKRVVSMARLFAMLIWPVVKVIVPPASAGLKVTSVWLLAAPAIIARNEPAPLSAKVVTVARAAASGNPVAA